MAEIINGKQVRGLARREIDILNAAQNRLCELLREGNKITAAARACGVDPRRVSERIHYGEIGSKRDERFARELRRAQGEAECAKVARFTPDEPEWRAAMEWLSRYNPADWSPRAQLDIRNHDEWLLRVVERLAPPELYARILAAIAAGPEEAGSAEGEREVPSLEAAGSAGLHPDGNAGVPTT